jgi:hypothetical protein
MPQITEQNKAIWQALYNAADQFQALKPWTWLLEGMIFAIKSPYSNNVGYCSIMGFAGEHFALAVYLNRNGLATFLEMQTASINSSNEQLDFNYLRELAMFEQNCFMVAFETKKYITENDEATMQQLDRKYKPRTRRPQIRYHEPSYLPWYITDNQVEELTAFIEQAIVVAKMTQKDPALLMQTAERQAIYTRIPTQTANETTWTDAWIDPFEEEEEAPNAANEHKVFKLVEPKRVNQIKKDLKKTNTALIMALCPIPSAVTSDTETKPFYAQLLLSMDYESGEALIMDMESAMLSPKQLANGLDEAFFTQLEKLGFIPKQIIVNQETIEELLTAPCRALGIELIYDEEDENLMAVDFFIEQLKMFI